jgi:signal transduction histidine kinase
MSAEGDLGGDATDSGISRIELLIARAFAFFKIGGIAQILVAMTLAFTRFTSLLGAAVLGVAVTVESVAITAVFLCRRRVDGRWVAFDVVFNAAALIACGAFVRPGDAYTWAFFMYPFTVITSFGIGSAFRRPMAVAVWATVLSLGYFGAVVAFMGHPLFHSIPNALTYYANTFVAFAVTSELRRSGRALDTARAEAVARAEELIRERERSRHARILHDRVLQTLESLAQGPWLDDNGIRAHVCGEAAWLRAFVQGVRSADATDLATALHAVVERKARTGLRVEFNDAGLRQAAALAARLPPAVVEALADATQEALTNVAKHSGIDSATVRTEITDTQVRVTVLDQGKGFDPAATCPGLGVQRSIHERIRAVGGEVALDTAAGAGTYVELTLPLPPG